MRGSNEISNRNASLRWIRREFRGWIPTPATKTRRWGPRIPRASMSFVGSESVISALRKGWGAVGGCALLAGFQGLARGLHGFAAEGAGDGGVHHDFGEAAGVLVELVNGLADDLVVAGGEGVLDFGGGGLDGGVLVEGELLPSGGLLAFLNGVENRLRFVGGFDDLAGGDVGFGVVEGVEINGLYLLVGEAVGGFDFYLGLLPAALFAGADV